MCVCVFQNQWAEFTRVLKFTGWNEKGGVHTIFLTQRAECLRSHRRSSPIISDCPRSSSIWVQVALAGGVLGANSGPQVGPGASSELLLPPWGPRSPPLMIIIGPRGMPRGPLDDQASAQDARPTLRSTLYLVNHHRYSIPRPALSPPGRRRRLPIPLSQFMNRYVVACQTDPPFSEVGAH